MKLTADEITCCYQKWVEEEIKAPTELRHRGGKFLFGVASATLGSLVAIEKLGPNPRVDDLALLAAMGLLVASMITATYMTLPYVMQLDEETDVQDLHKRFLGRTNCLAKLWFAFWLISLFPGVWAISR